MTAQTLLKRGQQLKTVAYDVGYGSASALARAFVRFCRNSEQGAEKGGDGAW